MSFTDPPLKSGILSSGVLINLIQDKFFSIMSSKNSGLYF